MNIYLKIFTKNCSIMDILEKLVDAKRASENKKVAPAKNKFLVDYVWIDGYNELRSKVRVCYLEKSYRQPLTLDDIPIWNFDGSSTNQATSEKSEVLLIPVKIIKDPFKKAPGYIVLCETWNQDGTPHVTNHRHNAKAIFDRKLEAEPWYGLEQEYFLMNPKTNMPMGMSPDDEHVFNGEVAPQKKYYCGVGMRNAYGRRIPDEHLQACCICDLTISGINAEVAPGQWEFQIGPVEGIDAADQLWLARYLLVRIAEQMNVIVSFHPKPVKGDWNGSGCHTNFSTKKMREGDDEWDGIDYIDRGINRLSKKHMEHMAVYGEHNEERMSGEHETSKFDVFTDGNSNRGCSIRRPLTTVTSKKGYFEDRRPASNCDPYLVTSKMFETIVLDEA